MPPSLGVLPVNAMLATDYFLIPAQPSGYALRGLGDLLQTLHSVKRPSPGWDCFYKDSATTALSAPASPRCSSPRFPVCSDNTQMASRTRPACCSTRDCSPSSG